MWKLLNDHSQVPFQFQIMVKYLLSLQHQTFLKNKELSLQLKNNHIQQLKTLPVDLHRYILKPV